MATGARVVFVGLPANRLTPRSSLFGVYDPPLGLSHCGGSQKCNSGRRIWSTALCGRGYGGEIVWAVAKVTFHLFKNTFPCWF